MPTAETSTQFARLADGTTLLRQDDGSFRAVASQTDHVRLAALSEAEVEHMAANDSDHPALDNDFWNTVDGQAAPKEVISIKLDKDILSYFRRQGRGYQTWINAILRNYVDAHPPKQR